MPLFPCWESPPSETELFHKNNVAKGFYWIREHLPNLINSDVNYECYICEMHDSSKNDMDEYKPYDDYFYGNNKSSAVVNAFRVAWLNHIHRNSHHWQHWVLNNDEPKEGEILIEIPYHYILEMICDWWSFSWKTGNLYEIFNWYDAHKDYIKMHPKSRKKVETILSDIKTKLDELNKPEKSGL